jgi:hypothetical protein
VASRVEVRKALLEGETVVVLSPEDFEALDASRRQLGSLRARLAQVTRELRLAQDLLREVETALVADDAVAADWTADESRRNALALLGKG